MLAVTCPVCGYSYSVAATLAGRRIKCAQCDAPFLVRPAATPPPPPQPTPADTPVVFADGSIQFGCPNPNCRRTIAVGRGGAGRKGPCPFCGQIVLTPDLVPLMPVSWVPSPAEQARQAEIGCGLALIGLAALGLVGLAFYSLITWLSN